MTDDDFIALIELLQNQLRDIGEPSLGDMRYYSDRPTEATERPPGGAGEDRLPAKQMLLAMLSAFDRHLSVQDRTTFSDATRRIAEVARDFNVEEVLFEDDFDFAQDKVTCNLAEAPDLSGIRRDLNSLIGRLNDLRTAPEGEE